VILREIKCILAKYNLENGSNMTSQLFFIIPILVIGSVVYFKRKNRLVYYILVGSCLMYLYADQFMRYERTNLFFLLLLTLIATGGIYKDLKKSPTREK
jgi:hypothetical protein